VRPNLDEVDRTVRGIAGIWLVATAVSAARAEDRTTALLTGVAGLGLLQNAATGVCGGGLLFGFSTATSGQSEGQRDER
jgi:hypothetical protein